MRAQDFGTVKTWEKDRLSTTMLRAHITLLKELSEDVGLPVSALITQAVDSYLVDVGMQKKKLLPEANVKEYRA